MLIEPSAQSQAYPIDAFQSDLRGICGAFNVEPLARQGDNMRGHLSVERFGGLDLARVGLNANHVARDVTDIRRDPGDHFFLILQHQGRAHLSQGDVSTWAEPGDMFLVDATKESQFRYEGNYSLQLSVHLPRDEMCQRFGNRIYGGISIDREDPMAVAMKAILAKLIGNADPDVQVHTVEAFYSVFGALLTERALGTGRTLNSDRQVVQQAVSLMSRHYRELEFSTQVMADQLGISLRRLQRAFKVIGETPHDRLQRYRVEVAREAILGRKHLGKLQTITEVAYASGFSDLSTFYRTYRKAYHCAPGESLLGPAH